MAVGYRDYYDALGVSRDASTEEIRTAYRRLARENHPDVNKNADAGDRFKEISEAYEVLRDEEKRRAYDRFGENWKAGQDVSGAAGFGGGAGGGRARGAGAGGFGGRDGGPQGFEGFSGFGSDVGGDTDFSDFFESLFGGGRASSRAGGRRRRGTAEQDGFSLRGGDQEAAIELTLEEAFSGGTRHFQLSDGRDYEVTIPPGVREGQRIRLAGEGGPGVGGGPNGDLFLRVHLLPHPRFRLKGRDVEVDLPVAPWEAALGASVPVALLDGGTAKVKVKAGSSSGVRLRLKGEGWPESGGRRGDLHAVVKIVVPKDLTKREHDLFEELAEVSNFDPRAQA